MTVQQAEQGTELVLKIRALEYRVEQLTEFLTWDNIESNNVTIVPNGNTMYTGQREFSVLLVGGEAQTMVTLLVSDMERKLIELQTKLREL